MKASATKMRYLTTGYAVVNQWICCMDRMPPLLKMLTKLTIALILVVYIVSTFFALFFDHLNTAHDFGHSALLLLWRAPQAAIAAPMVATVRRRVQNQISDLHLSVHFGPKRAPDLEQFCKEYIDIMKPSVVLATGDLTDARTRDPMGSRVFEEEWLMYWNALNKTNVTAKTIWLDIKGNHDADLVRVVEEGLHEVVSRISISNSVLWLWYNFIGVDACLDPSPKRPFNFIGLLNDKDISRITQMKAAARQEHSNYTIWFGHYPTSSIAMPSPGLRELINGPYLCGHYHTVGGLVNHMYSTQPTGYLELELSDWKDLRTIRLGAIDHGLFTFIDFKFHEWPVILVTNPKNSLYSMPNIEPWHRIANSTHIRALVFSKSKVSSVEVRIDDSDKWLEMTHISGPLYVHKWQPNEYEEGLHWIEVTAIDVDDNRRTVRHQFSLDGSKGDFPFGARLMLRTDNRVIGYLLFGLAVSICVLPFLILRFLPISKGPWFVGYVLDDYIGISFVWGMLIDGSYLPGGITYVLFSLNFYFAYGLLAYVLGMFTTWSYIVYIVLWKVSVSLSAQSFPEPMRPKYRKAKDFDEISEHSSLTRPPIRK
ncbi:unnamed protein product [Oppiella nova]|uniref:Calcineurin-like phosphoesterase domain-containing protein n=1 Tax=Oppiella nova TaxID=334625 RepID=A0A7R9LDY6_9ACAR|nr:unnamed protein product [Oppiella nova]CAG2162684.1 unnamed protein product [Oppiella nova]